MGINSQHLFPTPDSAETLGAETPQQQPSSPNSDYFSPRSDDGSPELYDSPLMVEDETEGKGSEAEAGDEVLNSSLRSGFTSVSKCDRVHAEPSESGSPFPLNCNDKPSGWTDGALVPNPSLLDPQMQNTQPFKAISSIMMAEYVNNWQGGGMVNLGNTCFLNSVLQCFVHMVPLLRGILWDKHSIHSHCANLEFCLLCCLQQLVEFTLLHPGSLINPWVFVKNLSYFSSSFQKYQQEDAQEFIHCFLDRLESCDSKQKECMSSQRDNIVKQVFGGCLVSKLKCCSCGHYSNKDEPSIDLSMEIEDADDLLTALHSFTKVEKLEFTCDKCEEQVSAEKQLSVGQSPSVAVFHLKRFKSDGCSVQKIDKHVSFPLDLDLLPFADSTTKRDEELKYVLYAIVVHTGSMPNSGHYYCFIRIAPNTWYKFDDAQVDLVREDYVLSQDAYILFYAKEGIPWFSSFVESINFGLGSTTWNTSPKSVLDSAATLKSPTVQDKFPCDSNEASDGIATDHKVGKIEIQYTRSLHHHTETSEQKDDSASVVPTAYASSDLPPPEVQKELSPIKLSRDASTLGISEDVMQKLVRSPSPEIYREDTPDVGFPVPRDNARSADRLSCKRRLEKDMDELEMKQARNLIKKHSKGSRAKQLLSAIEDCKTEASMSSKRSRRSEMSNSAFARNGSNVKYARSFSGTYR